MKTMYLKATTVSADLLSMETKLMGTTWNPEVSHRLEAGVTGNNPISQFFVVG